MVLHAKLSTDLGGPQPELGSQRRGRDLQRYSQAHERLVAGCLPVRWKLGESLHEAQVLMISSSNSIGKGLVFPKGGWETDETLATAAARETVEEAGVRGILEEPLLGAFPFHSNKAERLHSAYKGRCLAYMFVMRVEEELPVWPEQGQRTRVWVPVYEAIGKCRHEWMREALKIWLTRHGWEEQLHHSCQNSSSAVNGSVPCTQTKIAASM